MWAEENLLIKYAFYNDLESSKKKENGTKTNEYC